MEPPSSQIQRFSSPRHDRTRKIIDLSSCSPSHRFRTVAPQDVFATKVPEALNAEVEDGDADAKGEDDRVEDDPDADGETVDAEDEDDDVMAERGAPTYSESQELDLDAEGEEVEEEAAVDGCLAEESSMEDKELEQIPPGKWSKWTAEEV